ncbi:hypothetical protein QYM36_003414 [Artemia franciscana]|uniref:Histone acetyltransferase type B catalytic subunit n=1 Tax=Artemia franciscana TaxID=6661 RepID=A0AA88IHZ1_ARTSF|nr:hypothetical protein QYM36_003414 [Artemia franciscana]
MMQMNQWRRVPLPGYRFWSGTSHCNDGQRALFFEMSLDDSKPRKIEKIFGYKDLSIKIYYTAGHLNTYVGTEYTAKVDQKKFDVKADNLMKPLSNVLPPGFTTSLDEFCSVLEKEGPFKPMGELLNVFSTKDKDGSLRNFEVYSGDVDTEGFKSYHERIQTFILFFIDAASFIDVDDNKWRFFFVFEKYIKDGTQDYAVAGYATIYEYYAYPEARRPRISQMLVLPPFQGCGIGSKLLKTVYDAYIPDKAVRDITVEDPSEDFVRLRDFVDCSHCMKLEPFSEENLKKGFSESMATEARLKFKINKKQARRVYEILRLRATNVHDEDEYKKFRIAVKSRLNIPFQKVEQQIKKLEGKSVSEEEIKAIVDYKSKEERLEMLDKEYKQLEEEYNHVISRLEKIVD